MDDLRGYVQKFSRALDDEIKHEKELGGKSYRITEGELLAVIGDIWIYLFHVDVELSLPDDTPIRLEIGKKGFSGAIISIDGFDITLSLTENIGNYVDKADMYCEPWMLLEALKERLNELDTRNYHLAMKVLRTDYNNRPAEPNTKKGFHEQDLAVNMVLNNEVTFIWGPPGTGKTETLAKIVEALYNKKLRVLILSHSNVAVDGAISRIDRRLNGRFTDGEILRYGFAKDPSVRNNKKLSSFHLAARMCPLEESKSIELEEKRQKIKSQLANVKDAKLKKELAEVELELKRVRSIIRDKEDLLVQNARVLATTLSKAAADQAVYGSLYDVVLLDEASMAYIPQSFYAASLARKGISIIGDFRQLGPIALAKTTVVAKWLKRDIFDEAGIVGAVENSGGHPNLVMLREQHRMHPGISGFVNSAVYGGRLRDAKNIISHCQTVTECEPWPGEAIIFIDLSGVPSFCFVDGQSRFNPLSALISVNIAEKVLVNSNNSVALITPYATQSRLTRALAHDLFPGLVGAQEKGARVFASTVHRFQGSERDIVIFDCVDAYGHRKKPGKLLSSDDLDISRRLINVAVTRAKGKLIVLAYKDFFSLLPSDAIVIRLFKYLEQKGKVCKASELISNISDLSDEVAVTASFSHVKDICWFDTEKDAIKAWQKDIKRATKEIQIDLLNQTTDNNEWVNSIEVAINKGLIVRIRSDEPSNLPVILRKFGTHDPFIRIPITVIDRKIFWYGFPWIRGNTDVKKFLCFRCTGQKFNQLMMSLMNMYLKEPEKPAVGEHLIETYHSLKAFVENKKKCQSCGKPLTVKLNGKGNLFLSCTGYPHCKETGRVKLDLVDSFLSTIGAACPKCGKPLNTRLSKFGLFVGCSGYPSCKYKQKVQDFI